MPVLVCGNWLPINLHESVKSRRILYVCDNQADLANIWATPSPDHTGYLSGVRVCSLASYQYGFTEMSLSSVLDVVGWNAVNLTGEARQPEIIREAVEALGGDAGNDPPHVVAQSHLDQLSHGNEYIGSSACAACHSKQYAAWRATRHATSMATLESVQRHRVKTCFVCHVTGYAVPTGYRTPGDAALGAVGCECCHGPGQIHSESRDSHSITRSPDVQVCLTCHDQLHSRLAEQPLDYMATASAVCSLK